MRSTQKKPVTVGDWVGLNVVGHFRILGIGLELAHATHVGEYH